MGNTQQGDAEMIDKMMIMPRMFKSFLCIGLPEKPDQRILHVSKVGDDREYVSAIATALLTDRGLFKLITTAAILADEILKKKEQQENANDSAYKAQIEPKNEPPI